MSEKLPKHTINALDAMFSGASSAVSVGFRLGTAIQGVMDAASESTAKAHTHPVTKLLYVDKNRADSYTEDGSLDKPFKTISAAASIASSGATINVMAGSYVEDIIIPAGVSLTSNGLNQVTVLGDATFEGPASSQSLRGFIFIYV